MTHSKNEINVEDQNILDSLAWLERFYKKKAPKLLASSHVMARPTEAQITKFEKSFGESLPNDYRTFLLHNKFRHNFRYNYECLDMESVGREWGDMNKLFDRGVFDDGRIERHKKERFGNWKGKKIQEVWWSKKWLPISKDSCGNLRCIDFAPAKNGRKYQIMSMEIQDAQGPFISDYKSFTQYLKWYLTYLQLDKYQIYDWGVEITS